MASDVAGQSSVLDSEDAFLRVIDRHFGAEAGRAALGRGDDCAILPCPEEICLSTDLFLEDAHFRRSYFEPEDIGYKALAVNVSDVAAMAARPLGFSLSLIAPRPASAAFYDRLFAGMAALARDCDTELVGGDISGGDKLGFSITIWGQAVGQRFVTRSGARPGDMLFTVGRIGLARTGLLALERMGAAAKTAFPSSCAAHLRPPMRLQSAEEIGRFGKVRALMDVSDGLARDLPRLLGSLGANLSIEEDFAHPEVLAYCSREDLDPVEHMVLGGEDYALLGALDPADWTKLAARLPEAVKIGEVLDRPGLRLNGHPFSASGFDHFSQGGDHGEA
ncbi:MAG: thiamine-monophosphate kinase [Desulfovibrionales bacterium]|jgi:thiamine-monophosphate kinase|nr:thiamine-monophosphate kinase [Desulfovibrionales bacterium]